MKEKNILNDVIIVLSAFNFLLKSPLTVNPEKGLMETDIFEKLKRLHIFVVCAFVCVLQGYMKYHRSKMLQ